ncbi:MAG: hypothetical protein IJ736_02410 [Firmicutes bacterium]|nr:hypothetical protein [Bacillota bacterium]
MINNIEYSESLINNFSIEHTLTDGDMKYCASMASLDLELNDQEGIFANVELKSKETELYIGLETAVDSFEYVPMGIFIITETSKEESILRIKGYDRMILFEKKYYNVLQNNDTVKDLIEDIALKGNVSCDFDNSPNFSLAVPAMEELKGYSERELLKRIAEMTGSFIFMDRNGNLRSITNSTGTEIITKDNYFSLTANDAVVASPYKGIVMTKNGEWARTYFFEETSEDIYFIEENDLNRTCDLESIYSYGYLTNNILRGYECKYQGDPSVDIGDLIYIDTGDGYFISIIDSIKYNYNGGFNCEIGMKYSDPKEKTSENERIVSTLEKSTEKINEKLERIENGTDTAFNNTLVEVVKENVIASDIIEASSAFMEDLFVDRLETNIKMIKCTPNITKTESGYSWTDGSASYTIPTVADNIRPYIRIEGISLKFIEAHLTESGTRDLKINNKQVYYTSIADADNAYKYFTFTDPKTKYPSLTDEEAAMFKVVVRSSESEYEKGEFKFDLTSVNGVPTYEPKLIIGTGDALGNGKLIYEKAADEAKIYINSRTENENKGISIKDDGLYQIRGSERNKIPFTYISETAPESPRGGDIWLKVLSDNEGGGE